MTTQAMAYTNDLLEVALINLRRSIVYLEGLFDGSLLIPPEEELIESFLIDGLYKELWGRWGVQDSLCEYWKTWDVDAEEKAYFETECITQIQLVLGPLKGRIKTFTVENPRHSVWYDIVEETPLRIEVYAGIL